MWPREERESGGEPLVSRIEFPPEFEEDDDRQKKRLGFVH